MPSCSSWSVPAIVAEVVNVVAFLASEAGHGVNGQVIRFNGGLE